MVIGTMIQSAASDRLAARLAEDWSSGGVTSVTWLNHHTAAKVGHVGLSLLAPFSYVGIDGVLLLRLLGGRTRDRTSADLVLPRLLSQLHGARIALVGTRRPPLDRAADFISKHFVQPDSTIVDARDGFAELPTGPEMKGWVRSCEPNVVIVGLGAGLQESWALEVALAMPSGLVMTCGAFLNQVYDPRYYPRWAYPLRLNWAVRLARNPGKMWRRYTLEALDAIRNRRSLRFEVECLAGFRTHQAVVSGERGGALHDR